DGASRNNPAPGSDRSRSSRRLTVASDLPSQPGWRVGLRLPRFVGGLTHRRCEAQAAWQTSSRRALIQRQGVVRFSYRPGVQMYNRDDIVQFVIGAIHFVQDASGRTLAALSVGTAMLSDVEGFDSLNALEVLVQVSQDLGVEIPEQVLCPTMDPTPL